MAKPTYNEEQKRALIAEYEASGLSMNAFLKGEGKPSYPAFKRWYEAAKGGGAVAPVATGRSRASILAENKRQLVEIRAELIKQKAALLKQVEGIELEVMALDEDLAKFG